MSWLRRLTVILLILTGLAGVGGGGAGLVLELTRHATRAEAAAAMSEEIASRWRRLPADRIFPPGVSYDTAGGAMAVAHRVGIAPAASCPAALDPAAARAVASGGCITVLRATYLDPSGTLAVTMGIAVMPDTAAAARALSAFKSRMRHAGVRPVPLPGTVTHLFTGTRLARPDAIAVGPYLFMLAGGYTSGHAAAARTAANPGLDDLSTGLSSQAISVLTSANDPCGHKDIQC